jgi:hypothetical protein
MTHSLWQGGMGMFDKIKQGLVLLQAAPPVDFTGGILKPTNESEIIESPGKT